MANNDNYFSDRDKRNLKTLSELRALLPHYCGGYFVSIASRTSVLTRLGYARDIHLFLQYLLQAKQLKATRCSEITLSDLESVTQTDIEEYLEYLSFYTVGDKEYTNNLQAKARKLSSVRSLFRYLYNKDMLTKDVSSKVPTPKLHDKEIIRLEKDEMGKLLVETEQGLNLGERNAQAYHKHVALRDTAIVTLLLGTGIRISECVGLNIDDIDFDNNKFTVTRKGGNRSILYMPEEVVEALQNYLVERLTIKADTDALFLSLQQKRINVRTVQVLVKKYASVSVPLKHITPHKLRSTFGTNLYRETKDIYVVATVLGHSDVNTTKKHYAAMGEEIKRQAAQVIKLRPTKDEKDEE